MAFSLVLRPGSRGWTPAHLTALGALELVLSDLGFPVKLGEGVRAAEQILQK